MSDNDKHGTTMSGATRSGTTRFIDARRRGFLQGAALATGAAASGASLAVTPLVEPTAKTEKPASAGYRLTEHVREYYAKARF